MIIYIQWGSDYEDTAGVWGRPAPKIMGNRVEDVSVPIAE